MFTSPLPPVVIPEVDLFSYVFHVGAGAKDAHATPADKTVLVDGVGGVDRLTWAVSAGDNTVAVVSGMGEGRGGVG